MRVALYCRVNTFDKGQDLTMQVHELRSYASNRMWEVIGEYADEGVSGVKESRPALNKLMADAKQRKFDAVIVSNLDRFGRWLKHLVRALGDFEALGIRFVSVQDNFDLSTPSERQMFQIIEQWINSSPKLTREKV